MNTAPTLPESPVFSLVADAARTLGVRAYVVGGFVRDLVLGRASHDIDVVCVGSGIALAEAVGALATARGGRAATVSVFKNFGTAHLRADGWEVEFVGARRESYQRDSRKPIVEDGTLAEDQLRRDFTINALAISLNADDFGTLLDPFDGLGDLRRRTLRTPLAPGITFSDDPLRMLRAVRFATQLNFDIAPDTFEALGTEKDRLAIVSAERITEELHKIILSPQPSYGFKLLYQAGLLQLIFPELVALQGVQTIEGKGHKDNFYHTLQVLDNVAARSNDLWLRWAALLHDIAKPATKRFDARVGWSFHGHEELGARMCPAIFRRFKLPLNEPLRLVQKLVRLHLRPIPLVKEGITDSALRRLLFDAGDDLEALLTLCRADITSKNYDKVKKHLANFDQVERKLHELEARDQLRNFQPVITGEIIMRTFGLAPGREVGDIKLAVREAILEGEISNTYDDAYPYAIAQGERLGLTVQQRVSPQEAAEVNQEVNKTP